MEFLTCNGREDKYNKQLCESVALKQTLLDRPLPSIESLMARKAKEVSEISQVYFRAGRKELIAFINWVSSSLVEEVAPIQSFM